MKILEVGCGTGLAYQLPFESNKYEVIHLDIERGYECLDVQASATHLPFKDKAFDGLKASHILEHVPDPLSAIREFKRVAHQVIIDVPTLNAYRYHATESQEHIYSWSKSSFKHFLELVFDEVTISEMWIHRLTFPIKTQIYRHFINLLFRAGHTQLRAVCR